ncbi:MAG: peptidase MA family metallohydrolase [Terriglobia bacterium]
MSPYICLPSVVYRTFLHCFLVILSFTFLRESLISPPCLSDVIFLKNGNKIAADRTWEDGKKIYYERKGNIYSFPKDLIAQIDVNLAPPEESPPLAGTKSPLRSIPIEVLEKTLEIGSSLKSSTPSGVIQSGVFNEKALDELEKQARRNPIDREIQAQFRNALVEVINWHWSRNEWNAAEERLDQFLRLDPENFEARLLKASVALKKGEYRQAEALLLPMGIKNQNSADYSYLLGMTYYMQDKNALAQQYLKKSLVLKFRPDVDQLIRKIENENRAELDYKQSNSLHFAVRYEGTEMNQAMSQAILKSLEQSYQELELALNFAPRETLVVVLYPDEVFQDVTKSPGWVGALNDGKVRFPTKGLTQVDRSVQKILKHELTHSFIRTKAGGNCPVWLNEGLAQFLSGDSAQQFLPLAKQAVNQQKLPRLSQLEGSFMGLQPEQAAWAYQQSLLAVEFLIRTYGDSEVQKLLQVTGTTGSFEGALSQVFHQSYSDLEKGFQEYILRSG